MTKLTEYFNLGKGGGGFLRAESLLSHLFACPGSEWMLDFGQTAVHPAFSTGEQERAQAAGKGLYVVKLFK